MARRRPTETPPVPIASAALVPECLLAGPCIEVWDPTRRDLLCAFTAHRQAVRLWLSRHRIGPAEYERHPDGIKRMGTPWSYDILAATAPERLAVTLAWRGLPADWRPTPAPAELGRPPRTPHT